MTGDELISRVKGLKPMSQAAFRLDELIRAAHDWMNQVENPAQVT